MQDRRGDANFGETPSEVVQSIAIKSKQDDFLRRVVPPISFQTFEKLRKFGVICG
jgi:hypothetical protein